MRPMHRRGRLPGLRPRSVPLRVAMPYMSPVTHPLMWYKRPGFIALWVLLGLLTLTTIISLSIYFNNQSKNNKD